MPLARGDGQATGRARRRRRERILKQHPLARHPIKCGRLDRRVAQCAGVGDDQSSAMRNKMLGRRAGRPGRAFCPSPAQRLNVAMRTGERPTRRQPPLLPSFRPRLPVNGREAAPGPASRRVCPCGRSPGLRRPGRVVRPGPDPGRLSFIRRDSARAIPMSLRKCSTKKPGSKLPAIMRGPRFSGSMNRLLRSRRSGARRSNRARP